VLGHLTLTSDFIFEKSKYLWVCSGGREVSRGQNTRNDRYLKNWKIYSKKIPSEPNYTLIDVKVIDFKKNEKHKSNHIPKNYCLSKLCSKISSNFFTVPKNRDSEKKNRQPPLTYQYWEITTPSLTGQKRLHCFLFTK